MGSNNFVNDFKSSAGLTLVEVLFALAMLVVLLVASLAALTYSLKVSQFSKNKAAAAVYVQEGLEMARAARDEEGSQTFTPPNPSPLPPFTRTITRTDGRVDVTVSWSDGSGTHTTTGSTYFTNW